MTRSFSQLHLGDIERGLFPVFAVLGISRHELKEQKGINFEVTKDNLDYCYLALLATKTGKQFALRTYYRTPHPNLVELIGHERSSDPKADLRGFLSALEVPLVKVLWSIENP